MMKTIQILFIVLIISACSKQPEIIGEWSTEDKYGKKQTVIFKEDKTLVFIKNNQVNEPGSEGQSVKYELDESHTPAWIDIVVFDEVNKEEIMRIKGIYEFLSDNTFRMYIESDKKEFKKSLMRPSGFDKENTNVFTRK